MKRNFDRLDVMRKLTLSLLVLLSSCGSVQKMALRSSTPLFKKSSDLMTTEKSWDFFAKSAPGNLKFMELISLQDPDNLDLLGVLVKAYAGYAYAVPETLAFEDEILGTLNSQHKNEAIIAYTKALDYGLLYFSKKGIKQKFLLHNDEGKIVKILKDKMDSDDYVTILYTAQAWGSLINLQKDNIALVSQVSKVKNLIDWVCKKDSKIENNFCQIFNAQYEASRPKMLGGNPEKAEELYIAAIKSHPHHHLIRLNYLQFLILPGFEEDKYEKEASVLRQEFPKWLELNRDDLVDKSEYRNDQHLNLYNAIAWKRFQIIERNKKKIF